MAREREKRELLDLKKAIKKRGNKHRRQQLNRDLVENPDEAAHSEEDFGRFTSAGMNGLDRDKTRRNTDADRGDRPAS